MRRRGRSRRAPLRADQTSARRAIRGTGQRSRPAATASARRGCRPTRRRAAATAAAWAGFAAGRPPRRRGPPGGSRRRPVPPRAPFARAARAKRRPARTAPRRRWRRRPRSRAPRPWCWGRRGASSGAGTSSSPIRGRPKRGCGAARRTTPSSRSRTGVHAGASGKALSFTGASTMCDGSVRAKTAARSSSAFQCRSPQGSPCLKKSDRPTSTGRPADTASAAASRYISAIPGPSPV